jgi:N-glycosylase/DNA lyase
MEIKNILPFNLEIICDGGQAFRWNRQKNGAYQGVVKNHVLVVSQKDNILKVCSHPEMPDSFVKNYFDLDTDYCLIEQKLSQFEELAPAVKYCSGNRILRQDPWETTISFIVSANNSIPNIKRTIERICMSYGERIHCAGKTFYTFPRPEVLARMPEVEMRKTRCGYRAAYIVKTACMVSRGEVDLYGLSKLPTHDARKELLKLPGVGPKVADCIMLYSLGKMDAFPIDVWIKRVLQHIYFKDRDLSISKLQKFAQERFKELAGFAQQYLFHYTRSLWNEWDIKNG